MARRQLHQACAAEGWPRGREFWPSAHCVVTARTARRLRDDFALDDVHAVAIVLRFRERIELLEHELQRLRGLR